MDKADKVDNNKVDKVDKVESQRVKRTKSSRAVPGPKGPKASPSGAPKGLRPKANRSGGPYHKNVNSMKRRGEVIQICHVIKTMRNHAPKGAKSSVLWFSSFFKCTFWPP